MFRNNEIYITPDPSLKQGELSHLEMAAKI
jgi:hypothetical protein